MHKFIDRTLALPQNQSFFLFGARNTGKSSLIKQRFNHVQSIWIDLLDHHEEELLTRHPEDLIARIHALSPKRTHIVIDEIQKIPKLLDVVHHLIETTDKLFVMTGSSARKLKYGGANLLAGRAFVYHLFPFTTFELGKAFHLENALRWGTLPSLQKLKTDEEKLRFLQAYSQTYLKEEIWAEQIIRKLDPFRKFLEVSAQCNGKIINYKNIARDVGVDDKTIKQYFTILEDTLIGFILEPFVHSFRKRLSLKPKFYYFDTGVARALSRQLTLPLLPRTSAYGEAFEHFIILECLKLANYYQPEFRFSYLKTKDDAEIDLVVERPGQPLLFIEIKSNTQVLENDLVNFNCLIKDFGKCEAVCFSQDKYPKRFGNIIVLPWQEGLRKYF